MILNVSADDTVKLGLSTSATSDMRGMVAVGTSAIAMFANSAVSDGAILISTISFGGTGSTMAIFTAVFKAGDTGTLRIKGGVSATADHMIIAPGSYVRVYKVG